HRVRSPCPSVLLLPRPPTSPLLPYTTLFRSVEGAHGGLIALVLADDIGEIRLSSAHQDAQLRDDLEVQGVLAALHALQILHLGLDRKSTRLNSSHVSISYAVFCLKKKKKLKH